MDCVGDRGAGGAIPERVVNAGAGTVDFGVIEQGKDLGADAGGVCSDEDGGACLDGFLAFGFVAHDEDGLAEGRGFLLDTAGVGEEDGGAAHEVDEGDIVEGFDEGDAIDALEAAVDDGADVGVGVDGVDDLNVATGGNIEQGGTDAFEAVAEALAAVGGDEDDVLALGYRAGVALEVALVELIADPEQGVDAGVAGDEDAVRRDGFGGETGGGLGSGGEMERGEAGGEDAIQFLGKGFGEVAGAEAGFDVADGDAAVEGGERGGEGGCGVALDDEEIGVGRSEDGVEAVDDTGGKGGEGLVGGHDAEVEVRLDGEGGEGVVEEAAVLAGDADGDFE